MSANCRTQVFEDVRLLLENEGAMIKKQLSNTAQVKVTPKRYAWSRFKGFQHPALLFHQELYEKQLQMERKIITKVRKKEKKQRAAVNAEDSGETVSEEVMNNTRSLFIGKVILMAYSF